jgi:hypothetical protein
MDWRKKKRRINSALGRRFVYVIDEAREKGLAEE